MCRVTNTGHGTHAYNPSIQEGGWEVKGHFDITESLKAVQRPTWPYLKIKKIPNWAWWLIPLISALERLRQVDVCELEALLVYRGQSKKASYILSTYNGMPWTAPFWEDGIREHWRKIRPKIMWETSPCSSVFHVWAHDIRMPAPENSGSPILCPAVYIWMASLLG